MKSSYSRLVVVVACVGIVLFFLFWNAEQEERYVQLAKEAIAVNEAVIDLQADFYALRRKLDARPVAKDRSEEVATLTERIVALEKQLAQVKKNVAGDAKKIEEGFGAAARDQIKVFVLVNDLIRRVEVLEKKAKGKRAFVRRGNNFENPCP